MDGDFRLGKWLVCPKLNTVQSDGQSARIEHKFMEVLVCLAERSGEVVSKEELLRLVWADTFVSDEVLTRAISELRRTFSDDPKQPRLIETIPKRGYRLIAPVQRVEEGVARGATDRRSGLLARHRKALAAGVAVVLLAIAVAVVLGRRPSEVRTDTPEPIAVLPLQNTSAAKNLDFLRIGLADDIANTLSYYQAFSIRPFAAANKYAAPDADLQKAAREMRVADIITGHFVVAGNELEVTLEAVDATNNRVIWRDTLRGTTGDLIGIHQQITARVQHGLVAALGVRSGPNAAAAASRTAEAYELYLRAVSQNLQDDSSSGSGTNAINLLQRAVALDPGYALAWAKLGHLYYYEIGFDSGGKPAKLRAKAALQRAVALDPSRIDAATDLINIESEEGDLNKSYDDIIDLLRRRPDSGAVHLVHSYVLWYAGLLDEAASECEKTRSIDAGTTDLASCGFVFVGLNQYDRAREFLQFQSGTDYQVGGEVEVLIREGKFDAALQNVRLLPLTTFYGRQMIEPCLLHRAPTAEESVKIQKIGSETMENDDPFPKYGLAAWYSFCHKPELAFTALRRAITQNYCAYPQMETDPLLATIRGRPEFAELRASGIACQQRFLEHRRQVRSR
jgi:DNA-binding winged helix-turn-helix (wHTH) protein/TolB-like protein